MQVKDRFLDYISYDTQSDSQSTSVPSTSKQLLLAKHLAEELLNLGIQDAGCDSYGYVYAHIPPSPGCHAKNLALISHLDTAMEMPGTGINPRIICNYDGNDIVLNEKLGIITAVADFPSLKTLAGQDLIVTDGTTLLGADNKAGIAEIMSLCEYLMTHLQFRHPGISILFTPDEEIGRSSDYIDLKKLDAPWGYTVDGGHIGELSYENFNAATADITIHGIAAHPGYAKHKLKNAALLAAEFSQLLPSAEAPAYTEGKEGYFHLEHIDGTVTSAVLRYFIRDFDWDNFIKRQNLLRNTAAYMNQKYGEDTVVVNIKESYLNMYEKIKESPFLIDHAIAAMERTGIAPFITSVRGGTDGARLSHMGLPCPNICTGGENGHSRHEFVSVQAMEQVVDLLKNLVQMFWE